MSPEFAPHFDPEQSAYQEVRVPALRPIDASTIAKSESELNTAGLSPLEYLESALLEYARKVGVIMERGDENDPEVYAYYTTLRDRWEESRLISFGEMSELEHQQYTRLNTLLQGIETSVDNRGHRALWTYISHRDYFTKRAAERMEAQALSRVKPSGISDHTRSITENNADQSR